ncbi:fibronectin type III domain-containing protein [Anoxybacillus flavithermus]|uniref:fibronectin type III domain-containing protein n=1 Tax=Anoxybacillus flavithermus TaxID=33934 RepID=UPI001867D124|nr:fibronectin type III domain-containing protein [Anoxybacillus flavithermus]MBE2918580.1 fibronectin type III domain-containing protein [Anoxybacillus flavithermus]
MANGDVIKLGTLYMGDTRIPRPTKPWRNDSKPYTGAGVGNIQDYSVGATLEIRNTETNYEMQWIEVNDGGKKYLICDRVMLVNISWDDLNAQGLIFGKNVTIDGQQYKLRVLTGGSNYRSINGYSGGTPTTNEWDRWIVNEAGLSDLPTPTASDLDTIRNSDDLNSPHNQKWNWYYVFSWVQDTYTKNSDSRAFRGYSSARAWSWSYKGSYSAHLGWRPVLEVLNSAPVTSGSDSNLGNKSTPFIYTTTQSAQPPSAPSINAIPISKSKIDLYWNSVSGATGYHVYLNNVYQATITGTSYSFTGLSEYTSYSLGVQAYNGNGSSPITVVNSRTLDETPPSVSITGISKTNNSITMSFSGSDAHSGISGFYIYLDNSHVTTIYGTSGAYTYTGLQQGRLYKVSIKAFDNSGNVSAEDYRNIQTSANFEWDTPKTSGGNFNITATEWNRFLNAINSARVGKGLTAYNFTYASKGGDFYAYMFNQAVQAISAMNPSISPPSTRSSGDEIYASYFNRLRDSLNSI